MKRIARPAMRAGEFREGIDRLGIEWSAFGALVQRSSRTVKSYYYGERDVPNSVAVALTDLLAKAESEGQTSEPWWIEMVDRFGKIATSNLKSERDGLRKAVAAYCRGCEPEGLCRTAECPLRDFSPLPLVPLRRLRSA